MSTDYDKKRLSESAHRITISLDGVEPLTVTLPHPIVPSTIKATLFRSDGVIDIIAEKALHDVWPEDCLQGDQFRLDSEKLKPWADSSWLQIHLIGQFYPASLRVDAWPISFAADLDLEARRAADDVTQLRLIINDIFFHAVNKGQLRFQLKIADESSESADWYIRAHLPIRTSPMGTPILLLSAVDQRLSERLQKEGKLDRDRARKNFHRIFGHVSEEEKIVISIPTLECARLLRYVLRLNSIKIRTTDWLQENAPQGKAASPCLSTFIGCLYQDCFQKERLSVSLMKLNFGYCCKCWQISNSLKRCGRCKSAPYCSAKCQLEDWSGHKPFCCKA